MTNVYFVRHGEPNCNNYNEELRELSEKGLKGWIKGYRIFKGQVD